MGNPSLTVLTSVAVQVAHAHGVPLVINTVPLPVPVLRHGADIVVHSATKYLGGHGTTLARVSAAERSVEQRQVSRHDRTLAEFSWRRLR